MHTNPLSSTSNSRKKYPQEKKDLKNNSAVQPQMEKKYIQERARQQTPIGPLHTHQTMLCGTANGFSQAAPKKRASRDFPLKDGDMNNFKWRPPPIPTRPQDCSQGVSVFRWHQLPSAKTPKHGCCFFPFFLHREKKRTNTTNALLLFFGFEAVSGNKSSENQWFLISHFFLSLPPHILQDPFFGRLTLFSYTAPFCIFVSGTWGAQPLHIYVVLVHIDQKKNWPGPLPCRKKF